MAAGRVPRRGETRRFGCVERRGVRAGDRLRGETVRRTRAFAPRIAKLTLRPQYVYRVR